MDVAEYERLGAVFREARDAVASHLRKQADAEIARARWLQKRRGVPPEKLYHRHTGEPIDPTLVALTVAVFEAEADVAWCRAVEVASAEALKGESLEVVAARNDRAHIETVRASALGAI